jgi:hypothetical protein
LTDYQRSLAEETGIGQPRHVARLHPDVQVVALGE